MDKLHIWYCEKGNKFVLFTNEHHVTLILAYLYYGKDPINYIGVL